MRHPSSIQTLAVRHEALVDLHQPDLHIAAFFSGRGGLVEPWKTKNLMEALARAVERS